MQRDEISRLLNRSLTYLAANVLTHCFEFVSLDAVSCENSIGKEKSRPQNIMLCVMSIKCTGHELHTYMSNKIASMLNSGVLRSWLKILRPLLRHRFTLSIMIESIFSLLELFQLQMRLSFPFLRANDLRSSLLNIRAHIFLISCT